MGKRREAQIFSMSFLDCICCGFGAVILLFVISDARTHDARQETVKDLRGEVAMQELEVLKGQKDLVQVKNILAKVTEELVQAEGRAEEIEKRIEEIRVELAKADKDTFASKEHVNKLMSDLKALEEELRRLRAAAVVAEKEGERLKEFKGVGDRQYLTGLKIGGDRIMILVDCSASMLDDDIVGIIRNRNLELAQKLKSPKWVQTVATVDWLLAQMPATSSFQLVGFNETAFPIVEGTAGTWMEGGSAEDLDKAAKAMHAVEPEKATSLISAFELMPSFEGGPDNIVLLTDGLPTMGTKKPWGTRVSSSKRKGFFVDAVRKLSKRIPVNVILYHMEGDPEASPAFWQLAKDTRGSYFCPSRDWP
ncbi:MAG: hypothetical protein ACI9TH_003246 [Kiritimatiellia bacterium]|jgi:hypothetical protein